MTLQELITDLKAAGANENTLRLAMNCYELGLEKAAEICLNEWSLQSERDAGIAFAKQILDLRKETQ